MGELWPRFRRIVSADLNDLICKLLEQADLRRVKGRATPGCPSIPWHAPHGPRELQGPEHELHHWHVAVLLSACPIHGRKPALLRVIDTGIRHQQMLRLLDAQCLIIDQHVHRLPPQPRINIETEVVEQNLALQAQTPENSRLAMTTSLSKTYKDIG
jgi:hypothetical protein